MWSFHIKSTYIIIALVIIIIILLIALLNSSSNNTVTSTTTSVQTQNNTPQNTNSNAPKVPQGSEVTLGTGHYTVGKQIKSGLYNIYILKGQGSIDITAADGENILSPSISAHPNPNPQNQFSVNKIRIFLGTGDKISLQGVSEVKFKPTTLGNITTPKKVTLYTGAWVVGKDIAPGKYIIDNSQSSITDVFAYHADGTEDFAFTLDAPNSYQGCTSTYTGSFEKGETIVINGSQGIDFTPAK